MAVLDPYRTLGLRPGASLDEVRSAYRRLAKRYHPDTTGSATSQRFIDVQRAYEMLTSSVSRGARDAPRSPARPTTRPRPRPTSGRGPTPGNGARGPGPSGSAASSETGGPDAHRGRGGSRRAGSTRTGRSGPRRKATLGSTSYDEAAATPFEPGWQGASWYGPASGTYWTINPREYADPRKHGPEYQERARRVATLTGTADEGVRSAEPSPTTADDDPRERASDDTGAARGPHEAPASGLPPSRAGRSFGGAGLVGIVIAATGVAAAAIAVLAIAGQT